jgi:LuxR family maltose regulon positive regulatory protein
MGFFAPRTRNWLMVQEARFHLWQGNLAAALRWEQESQVVGEGPLTYLQHLTSVRLRLAQYTRDPQANFLLEATNILTPLLATAEARGWGSHVIEILMLRALTEEAQGNLAEAQTTLIRALILAEPEGYRRLFVDEGEAMQSLLSDFQFWLTKEVPIENQPKLLSYADKLLKLFPIDQQPGVQKIVIPHPSSQPLVEALSARELEVLYLVATGLSNTQIATQLIVTTGTVKTHINHIFGKLAVENRMSAVVRARELGLLTS